MAEAKEQTISISVWTIVTGLLVIGAVFLAYVLKDLLLVILTSVVIASAVEPASRALSRYKVPRVLAVLAIYIFAFLLFFGTLYLFIPPLFTELSNIASRLPGQFDSFNLFDASLDPLSAITGGLAKSISLKEVITEIQLSLVSFLGGETATAGTVFSGTLSFILIVVFSFYLSVQPNGIEEFIRLVTPSKQEEYLVGLWERTQHKIGQWMKGQLLLAIFVGVMVYLGLTILGVKYALVLALIAAMFELIPVFGPILSAIPAVLLGFSDSAVTGLMVGGFFVIIQQFENHLIYPLVVKKIVGIPPILSIIALLVGAQLAGFLGIILSIPAATLLMEIAGDFQKRKLALRNGKK